jgi:hypothetical protein
VPRKKSGGRRSTSKISTTVTPLGVPPSLLPSRQKPRTTRAKGPPAYHLPKDRIGWWVEAGKVKEGVAVCSDDSSSTPSLQPYLHPPTSSFWSPGDGIRCEEGEAKVRVVRRFKNGQRLWRKKYTHRRNRCNLGCFYTLCGVTKFPHHVCGALSSHQRVGARLMVEAPLEG